MSNDFYYIWLVILIIIWLHGLPLYFVHSFYELCYCKFILTLCSDQISCGTTQYWTYDWPSLWDFEMEISELVFPHMAL